MNKVFAYILESLLVRKIQRLANIETKHILLSSVCDSRIRGPGFDTRSKHLLSFLLSLIQKGQLSLTGKNVCTKYWLTAKEV